jgi:hypothetical protein
MENEKTLIWIKKIIRGKDGLPTIEDDVLRKKDVKRVRRWHKNDKDIGITGDIVAITLEELHNVPLITIRVNESLESITERLGIVHGLND